MSRPLKITDPQKVAFWRMYRQACQIRKWDDKDKAFRMEWLTQVLRKPVFSLTDLGRVDDYTKVKAALMGIINDTDLKGQMAQANMGRKNLLVKIGFLPDESGKFTSQAEELGELLGDPAQGEAYVLAVMSDKFNATDFTRLSDTQLEHLRSTLARAINVMRPAKEPSKVEETKDEGHAAPQGEAVLAALTTGGDDADPEW